jgi:hypothetical protein
VRGELPACVILATGRGHGADKRGQLQDRASSSRFWSVSQISNSVYSAAGTGGLSDIALIFTKEQRVP